MALETGTLPLLRIALDTLEKGFAKLPAFTPAVDSVALSAVLEQVAGRMRDNYPYQHPLYAGQMLKPPHPVARLAYMLALWINPNNHALDGGRASSAMEKEAVAGIAGMFGFEEHLGHLTTSGTIANLEALWVAGRLHPGRKIVGSEHAHYTHSRISDVLQLEFESVPADANGRMSLGALEDRMKRGDIGTVVATLGTTALGSVDPLHGILRLAERYSVRVHVDSAYGGYYTLADYLEAATRSAYDAIPHADSLVVDPHKHGLQPYGCGCILFADPSVGRFYKHDSPYTYFSSDELHLGEISLECSRAGASAVALWATQQLLPLTRGGEFARGLENCRKAAQALHQRLATDSHFLTALAPELDIVVWAPRARLASEISRLSRRQFEEAAKQDLHLAVAQLPASLLKPWWPDVEFDQDNVTCMRSCLMKPEHLEWVDRIWEILDDIA